MARFKINQLLWPPSAKVLRSAPGRMLVKAPGYIVGDAGIERMIVTKDDIHSPVHRMLNHGTEQRTHSGGQAHGQRTPEGNAASALDHAGTAGISRQHAQQRQKDQRCR